MLKKKQMQEIQDLKLRGYSINEIIKYYEEQGLKPTSLPTLRKYYQMDTVPEVPNQKLVKDKTGHKMHHAQACQHHLQNDENWRGILSTIPFQKYGRMI